MLAARGAIQNKKARGKTPAGWLARRQPLEAAGEGPCCGGGREDILPRGGRNSVEITMFLVVLRQQANVIINHNQNINSFK